MTGLGLGLQAWLGLRERGTPATFCLAQQQLDGSMMASPYSLLSADADAENSYILGHTMQWVPDCHRALDRGHGTRP